ncbi:DUF1206 domain-containing protein [Erythrobacter ani]|uniref:DUF1206 domain-containing protein n=1 Tax=Erythrobacter ani TaxID=2827235 RepID=A0ABS6SQ01_9SPHN|nr:DUF1206 domain-containing protein [Erythrobacter ani]
MVDKSEKFNWLVRVGYFSRAVLYTVLGYIALTSAGEISEGTDGIFKAVENLPGGTALLWILVVGLFAYALFRFASPLFDIENNGSDTKGWGKRIGHAGSGIAHLVLAWTAYQFATGSGGSGGGSGASQAAAGVLSVEFGGAVIGILGLAFFIAAVAQAKKAVSGDFMNRISASAPGFTRMLGGAGFAARAVVYAVIGWSLVQTGFLSSGADNVKTLGGAVASLAGTGWLFTVTAVGLLLFGLFSFILARYRIIPDLDSDAGVPEFRAA